MPQPLARIRPNPGLIINPTIVLEKQPELAFLMMQVITTWTSAEAQIGDLLIALLGAKARPALMEAIEARSAQTQREIFMREARATLPDYAVGVSASLLIMFKQDSKSRNRLVHWQSGISPTVDDGIVLVNTSKIWLRTIKMFEHSDIMGGMISRGQFDQLERPQSDLWADAWVYKKSDFERMLSDLGELFHCLAFARELLYDINATRSPETIARTLSRLRESPRLVRAEERLNADRQRTLQAGHPPECGGDREA